MSTTRLREEKRDKTFQKIVSASLACYLTTIIWEFLAQRHVQCEREPSSNHPEGSTITVWTAAQSTASSNSSWHLTGTEVILWEVPEELHCLSFLPQSGPRYSSSIPIKPAMCIGPCWVGDSGFISPLSFEDLWIAARVKQIKVQNLHSCHSEAVHIYTAPPYLWLGCFPGKWKFELIKTEHSTDTFHSILYFTAKDCNTRTLPKDRQGWQRVPVFSGTGFGELSVWVDARCAYGHQGLLAAPSQVSTYWREGPVITEHCNLFLGKFSLLEIAVPDYGDWIPL